MVSTLPLSDGFWEGDLETCQAGFHASLPPCFRQLADRVLSRFQSAFQSGLDTLSEGFQKSQRGHQDSPPVSSHVNSSGRVSIPRSGTLL